MKIFTQTFHLNPSALGLASILALMPMGAEAFNLTRAEGAAETAYAEWSPVPGAIRYDVTCSGEGLANAEVDHRLVRRYPDCIRVDIPGLAKGDYTISVKAYNAAGSLLDDATSPTLTVKPYTREGFAFNDGYIPGAYKADGTLKDGADVLYITADNVNTITYDVIKNTKGQTDPKTGLANILSAIGKGYHKTPLAIRFIGAVADTQFEGLKDGNYINFQGNNNTDKMIENITLEGIGSDATLYGYGIAFKRARAIEIRNLGIMLYGDDGVGMDTDNNHIWLHNIDFYYGKPGSDADQVKGDGSIDMKYRSTDVTINNCHFYDSGKVMGLGGTTGEEENLRITFHHNWFDHADSRCPRLHYVTGHIYNNYYDGVAVYGIGNTTESSAFIENNYFRGVKRPIMTAGQGTDMIGADNLATYKGTFSKQDGGMNKAFNNIVTDVTSLKLAYHTDDPVQFDAYLATSRDEQVPSTYVSRRGNWAYSNFDTDPSMYITLPDPVEDVPAIVTANAGRLEGGDLKWVFDNTVDDDHHELNAPLKAKIVAYTSQLLEIQTATGFSAESAISVIGSDTVAAPIKVYNIQGQHVATISAVSALHTLGLPSGIYILRQGSSVKKVTL